MCENSMWLYQVSIFRSALFAEKLAEKGVLFVAIFIIAYKT